MTTDDRQDPAERKSTFRPVREPDRNYPVDRTADDRRFTNGLMFDLLAVLEKHGYPRLTGLDITEFFHTRIFGFLYGLPTSVDTAVDLIRSGALIPAPGPDPVDESRPILNPAPRNPCLCGADLGHPWDQTSHQKGTPGCRYWRESRPAEPLPEFDRDGYPVPTRRCAGVNDAGTPFFGDHIGCEHDPARRFDRLQADPRPDTTEPPPWDSAEPAVMPWEEMRQVAATAIPEPPSCPVHPETSYQCQECGDLRREFYLYIARKMAETAEEIPGAAEASADPIPEGPAE